MYESHFGLSGSPFQLNPDPAFYFDSRGHSNALAYLKFGAHQGEGFIVVTGEIGAGKTTLVRTLLEGLNPEQVVAAQVVSTQLESSELLQAILMSFGVASASTSKAHLIGSLEAFLTSLAAKGRRALLIIDEAQNLKHEAVEELRMLSNFQLGKYGLLQSFLVGQPELRQLLQSKSMEQLRQRVIASCHLGPLLPPETRAYIEHRLRLVGWTDRPEFEPDAFDQIHHWTGGVPRRINRLCNRLLLGAFLGNEETITATLVDRTASELKSEIGELSQMTESPAPTAPSKPEEPRPGDVALASQRQRSSTVASASPAEVEPAVALSARIDSSPVKEPRPRVRLVPGATAGGAGAVAELPRRGAASAWPGTANPVDVPTATAAVQTTASVRADTRTPLSPVPVAKAAAEPGEAAVPGATAGTGPDVAQPSIKRRVYRDGEHRRPVLCLVESMSDFLEAGTLAEVFLKFPALPSLVAVRPADESTLSFGDTGANELPMPAIGLHLEGLTGGFASRTHLVMRAFEEVLNEFNPSAVLVMGSSDAVLACALLAKKSRIPLARIGGGDRSQPSGGDVVLNGALIDRIADMLFVNRMDSYYTLYHEGIQTDRVLCVGNLVGDMLKRALPHAPSPSEIFTAARIAPHALESAGGYVLVTIDPQTEFSSADAQRELFSLIADLAVGIPVVWPMATEAIAALQQTESWALLVAAPVVLLAGQGYLQCVGLLEKARCHVNGSAGALTEEAASLRIPSARLVLASTGTKLQAQTPASAQILKANPAAGALDILRERLAPSVMATDSPAYWDSGAATRIANSFVNWLSTGDTGPRSTP